MNLSLSSSLVSLASRDTLLPVPVSPTHSTCFWFSSSWSMTQLLRTVSTVGTKMAWNGVPTGTENRGMVDCHVTQPPRPFMR